MDEPIVTKALAACKKKAGFKFEIMQTSFHLGQRTLIGNPNSELPRWQDDLLSCCRGLGIDPSTYFKASRKLGRGNRRTVQHLIYTGCSAGSEPSTTLRVNEPVNSHAATPIFRVSNASRRILHLPKRQTR
ncbi:MULTISPECIES: hypothetical protein [Rhizobium]|uniref:hypothetical protein n=1 Tax=Rhizobium TaxID=379 RepID=UPI001C925110|nr:MULTISPECIES: hypothetical protein [Rhizobium]